METETARGVRKRAVRVTGLLLGTVGPVGVGRVFGVTGEDPDPARRAPDNFPTVGPPYLPYSVNGLPHQEPR